LKARKKKKADRKKAPSSVVLSPEEEATLGGLLEKSPDVILSDLKQNLSSPKLACALIDNLPANDPRASNILLAIKELFDQKEVRKAIRKAAFKLKQSGISVPDLEPEKSEGIILKKVQVSQPLAYVGPIDGTGARAVFIMAPQIPKGMTVVTAVASDENGIMEFAANKFSRKQAQEVKKFFFERVEPMVETTLAHAATVLENAYRKKESPSDQSSRAYLELRAWLLERTELLDAPPVYELIGEGNAPSGEITVSQARKLLENDLMATWILDPEELKPLVEEIIKAEQSPILVSESQKLDRIEELKKEAIANLYPPKRRKLMKNRLEEMAYMFFKLEDETNARLSLAAASSLAEKQSVFRENVFLMEMVNHSLEYYLEGAQDKKDEDENLLSTPSTGIILPP